jgi:predicted TIM-barrel fold metal-dependent hydrolase
MIIDCHCHAGPGDGLSGPWDTTAPVGPYLAQARAAGIDATVFFAVFRSDYAVANRAVARIVADDPRRRMSFTFVHAARDRGRIEALVAEGVERHGFRGIKVHRHDARITGEVCEVARRYRLPVLYDVMGETAMVELLATEFADVDFIIPHLGSFSDDWRAQVALLDPLERHPNIHTDTARASGASSCCATRCVAPGRRRSCSDPTGRGCIPASSCTRSACSGCRRRAAGSCSARTSCG